MSSRSGAARHAGVPPEVTDSAHPHVDTLSVPPHLNVSVTLSTVGTASIGENVT